MTMNIAHSRLKSITAVLEFILLSCFVQIILIYAQFKIIIIQLSIIDSTVKSIEARILLIYASSSILS